MKRTIKTMIAVLLVGTALTGCGTIKPPQLNNTATTVPPVKGAAHIYVVL